MKVYFYSFSKRKKSTKRVGTGGLVKDVDLKEPTNIIEPSLTLSFNPIGYNYCYIPDFNRYYFVSNVHSINRNVWQVDLNEDYLASAKTVISSTNALVLYADTSIDTEIADPRIPTVYTLYMDEETADFDSNPIIDYSAGFGAAGVNIILGITGNGSFGCYCLKDPTKIDELLDGLDPIVSTFTDILDVGKQMIFGGSAAECLKSAIGIPFIIPNSCLEGTDLSPGTPLVLGNYPCKDGNGNSINGRKVKNPIFKSTATIDIPWGTDDWRRVSQYTDIFLYMPLIGTISLPATSLVYDDKLNIEYAINITSGDISAIVMGNITKQIVGSASGNCAIPVGYGSTGINTSKLTTGILAGVGAAAAIATGGASLAAELAIGGSMFNAAASIISAQGGTSQGNPGIGGGAAYGLDRKFHIWVNQKVLTENPENLQPICGKPYMAVAQLGNFHGYVQTDGAQVAGSSLLDEERNTINQMLDSGIYLE